MERRWGIVQGPDPLWPQRLILRGEDGGTYLVGEQQRSWFGRAPAQCLTVGSSVRFLLQPGVDGEPATADLRLPEHHPDRELLQGLRPGRRIWVRAQPDATRLHLDGALGVRVVLCRGRRPVRRVFARPRRLRAVVLSVADHAVVRARLARTPRNWDWWRWRPHQPSF